jgi:hypothetical protein
VSEKLRLKTSTDIHSSSSLSQAGDLPIRLRRVTIPLGQGTIRSNDFLDTGQQSGSVLPAVCEGALPFLQTDREDLVRGNIPTQQVRESGKNILPRVDGGPFFFFKSRNEAGCLFPDGKQEKHNERNKERSQSVFSQERGDPGALRHAEMGFVKDDFSMMAA